MPFKRSASVTSALSKSETRADMRDPRPTSEATSFIRPIYISTSSPPTVFTVSTSSSIVSSHGLARLAKPSALEAKVEHPSPLDGTLIGSLPLGNGTTGQILFTSGECGSLRLSTRIVSSSTLSWFCRIAKPVKFGNLLWCLLSVQFFSRFPFLDWILQYVSNVANIGSGDERWAARFATICWLIWKQRCNTIFGTTPLNGSAWIRYGTQGIDGFSTALGRRCTQGGNGSKTDNRSLP
ncbi:hypothetical protein V6N13_040981 [Hibiscus sabdariffa]